MNLVWTQLVELEQEIAIELKLTFCTDICLDHPSADTVRIELLIPSRVQRIRQVNATAITADFDHLGPTVKRLARLVWMGCTAYNPADLDRASELWVKRIRHVVLPQL